MGKLPSRGSGRPLFQEPTTGASFPPLPPPTARPWRLPVTDADPLVKGQGAAVEVSLPLLSWRRNGGWAPKRLLPPLGGRATPCYLEGRGPPAPLSFRVSCPALLFLKAKSVRIGKLLESSELAFHLIIIVYVGNVGCPHVKIYILIKP